MKKRSCSSSSSVFEEANGVEDEAEPQQPSSCAAAALDELHKEKNENGEETLVPPNPNLDDGFYEIETIRRKRLRKGQLQYLIKWRGWPETANTWEPLGNLQSVPDLIDAFEESLRHFPPQVPTLTNDYDPKLSELKEAPTNTGVQLDNLAIHFQHPIPSRGAKRRKSASSVKRFKRDPDAAAIQPIAAPIHMPDATNTACNIVKIIKPIGYSASLSDNMHDVLVTFMAMRSDGTEVMVDNRYLKAYNPLLEEEASLILSGLATAPTFDMGNQKSRVVHCLPWMLFSTLLSFPQSEATLPRLGPIPSLGKPLFGPSSRTQHFCTLSNSFVYERMGGEVAPLHHNILPKQYNIKPSLD
ncbi:hypothetical protein JHK87_013874 [Glycine soja]|nr:hypothetical protein JHK87_013874 [Glycine soja]